MKNHELAGVFRRMGRLLDVKGENVFKVRSYFKAADQLEGLPEDIEIVQQENRLADISGIGKAFQSKIIEFCQTGKIQSYENLITELPESLLDLFQVPSLGPKKIKELYAHYHVTSVSDLEVVLQKPDIRTLKGFQKKTIDKIIEGLALYKKKQALMDIASATRLAERIMTDMRAQTSIKKIVAAGSVRRMKETIRDIDLLGVAEDSADIMDAFVRLPYVKTIQSYGTTKSSILTDNDIQVDLRIVDESQFGAAWIYFTGSKNFNILLRQLAMTNNQKVNEYGVFQVDDEEELILAKKTEKDCFKALNLPYIPPEVREDIGFRGGVSVLCGEESHFRLKRTIKALVDYSDMKGDLHVHSSWSDGKDNIETLVQAAIKREYQYIGICDHSEKLVIANGLSAEAVFKKKKEIAVLQNKYPRIHILHAAEVEIDRDGNLDYDDDVLQSFDIVIAAIHTGHEQSAEQLTQRLLTAIENPFVHVIAHPTGAHLGKREPYDIDFNRVCQAAVKNHVCLEINAFPVRMDLNAQRSHIASQYGVKLMINTDAHAQEHLDYMIYGVGVARRAWLKSDDVVNTGSRAVFLEWLNAKK
ncbi:MAG: DNA polymerase/3'-5' exonuclease PolX [Candidatus Omnitrophica bacterium]|nr:DNA polymerase/3'-5' exonuclease PolX [Candidatus Omnitrophota bacterium]